MSTKPQESNIIKIIIIVVLLLAVIGGATFAGIYYVGQKAATGNSKSAGVAEAPEITYALDDFLVNLLDEEGRILKVNVFVAYEENDDLSAELIAKKPIIRDLVNTAFRSRKAAEFGATGADAIKIQLIAIINTVLNEGKISHIYFNEIFIQ